MLCIYTTYFRIHIYIPLLGPSALPAEMESEVSIHPERGDQKSLFKIGEKITEVD